VINAAILLGGSAAGPGDPGDLGTLVVHYLSDSGVSLSGSDVTAWTPDVGNANSAKGVTASTEPTFVSSALNGYPSIQDGLMSSTNPSSVPGTEWTMFGVMKWASNACMWGLTSGGIFTNRNGFFGLLFPAVAWLESTTAIDTNWHIWVAERVSGVVTLYLDDVALTPTYSGSMPGAGPRWVLHHGGSADVPGQGQVVELGCYDGALGGTNRTALYDLLATKYAL
jgi:hypothetical protein